ncbi:asparaginase [Zavarzinia compransoris]|uniref:asparaginase n=1 Tax=Zavarzinia marina TaxID=2911065 RepID=UPI001F387548|nr:asparaginase [Zavarzinia marina]MCF4165393.1 asparaginase [Zavarzinia marina]
MSGDPVLVEVLRGGILESRHRGAYAVMDADGRLVAGAGDLERPRFPRSAMKILQALPLVESGAADAFACTPVELAMACASHNGEPFHVEAAAGLLARLGLGESDLACGPQKPSFGPAARALAAAGEAPCRLHNNCSGKHAGFLTLARHFGAPTRGYERREHPVQQAVFETVAAMAGTTPDMPHGIDGCAAPNPVMPLSALALAMARLAAPDGLSPVRARAAARLRRAMADHPDHVAGTGRACTRLMRACRPGTVVKTGAEGVFTAIAPDLGLGFACKIDDGATRASTVLIAALLDHHGLIREEARRDVADLIETPLTNWNGTAIGLVRMAADWARRPTTP